MRLTRGRITGDHGDDRGRGLIDLGHLEIHAWHGCNLSCESCSHYSSLGLKGGPTADECAQWMKGWSGRLKPLIFSIVGGEPTLNRDLARIVRVAGAMWPEAGIRVVTNGFLLARHPELPRVLSELGKRALLDVSSHHSGTEFQAKFTKVENIVREWVADFGIRARIAPSDKYWTRRYGIREDGGVAFGDGDPRLAWKNCVGKKSPQIFDGKLWKCPPIAYFDLLAARVKLEESWHTLAHTYRALEPDCSDADLRAFFAKEEEKICRLCPNKPEPFKLPNPLRSKGARAALSVEVER